MKNKPPGKLKIQICMLLSVLGTNGLPVYDIIDLQYIYKNDNVKITD